MYIMVSHDETIFGMVHQYNLLTVVVPLSIVLARDEAMIMIMMLMMVVVVVVVLIHCQDCDHDCDHEDWCSLRVDTVPFLVRSRWIVLLLLLLKLKMSLVVHP